LGEAYVSESDRKGGRNSNQDASYFIGSCFLAEKEATQSRENTTPKRGAKREREVFVEKKDHKSEFEEKQPQQRASTSCAIQPTLKSITKGECGQSVPIQTPLDWGMSAEQASIPPKRRKRQKEGSRGGGRFLQGQVEKEGKGGALKKPVPFLHHKRSADSSSKKRERKVDFLKKAKARVNSTFKKKNEIVITHQLKIRAWREQRERGGL